jgi:hypothetical protein
MKLIIILLLDDLGVTVPSARPAPNIQTKKRRVVTDSATHHAQVS